MPDNLHMAVYWIGDVQGCDSALQLLLDKLGFSPSRDMLYLLGDVVNRGPDSLAVLRRLRQLQGAAHCILGNHDLHALAVGAGLRASGKGDTLGALLAAPDAADLLTWLRHQDMAHHAHGVLMVHAGVLPQWTVDDTLALASEVQSALRGPDWRVFLQAMYGNTPTHWDDRWQGHTRLRVITNALTRLRFCSADGHMEMLTKEGAASAPPGHMPWFDVPGRRTQDAVLAFGHWSTLGWLDRRDVWSLDSGCVWGGCLTALQWQADGQHTRWQVPCAPQTTV